MIWWCHDYYILQGVEGVCFYVVGSGEFEVLATKVRIFFSLTQLSALNFANTFIVLFNCIKIVYYHDI